MYYLVNIEIYFILVNFINVETLVVIFMKFMKLAKSLFHKLGVRSSLYRENTR